MKKFSKVLCLVLVLAMMAGLCAVGTSAAYADADKITYKEAVDVLSALGVLQGDDKGFRPGDGLTRAEACKIAAYLCGAEAYTGTCSFKDCKGHWASNYIAYCAAMGYVNGVGNNKFDPSGKLTGYAWAKILLGVLGYDAEASGMTGANWQIAVASLAKANGLVNGLAKFDGLSEINREEAAQMGLNALKATCVYYDGGLSLSVNGTTIKAAADCRKASAVPGTNTIVADLYQQLGEKLYGGKLVLNATSKDGRPAHTWTYAGIRTATNPVGAIGQYVDNATFTYVFTPATALIAANNTEALTAAKKFTGNAFLKIEDTDDPADGINDEAILLFNGASAVAFNNFAFNSGDTLEVFVDPLNPDVVKQVVVTRESAAQIVDVKANTGKATTMVGYAPTVYEWNIYVDTDMDGTSNVMLNEYTLPGYTAEYVKGAYLSVVLNSGSIIASAPAATVTGGVTKFTQNVTSPVAIPGNATMEGTAYTFANATIPGGTTTADFKAGNYTLVLNKAGYVTAVVTNQTSAATLDNVVFGLGGAWEESSKAYSVQSNVVYQQVVKLDGTVEDVIIGYYKGSSGWASGTDKVGTGTAVEGLAVMTTVPATLTSGEYMSLSTSTAAIDTPLNDYGFDGIYDVTAYSSSTIKSTDTKFEGSYLTPATKIILVNTATSSAVTKATVYTGAINYTPSATPLTEYYDVLTVTTAKGEEVVAIVYAGSNQTVGAVDVLYVPAPTAAAVAGGFEQLAYKMDGTATTITVAAGSAATTGFVTYKADANNIYTLTDATASALSADQTWSKTNAAAQGNFEGYTYVSNFYGTSYISLTKGGYDIDDVPAANIKVVDVRNPIVKAQNYNVDIASVDDIEVAKNTFVAGSSSVLNVVKGDVQITADGAVIFFVTSVGAPV